MNKILIFEGPDGVGKTTIALELTKRLKFQYFKNRREHLLLANVNFIKELYHCEMAMTFLSTINFEGGGLVMDRFTPSEWAYSYALNRETDKDYVANIDSRLAGLGATIIYCYKTELIDWSDEFIKEEQIESIKAGYEDYFAKTKMRVIRLCTDDMDLEKQIKYIIDNI